ncbi:hypothetical protein V3C99_015713 [Haemonchus contortus]
MTEVADTKICTYMYSVSCSIIAEVLMIFGYRNNAWLVLFNNENELQRGLNDDCLKTHEAIKCHTWQSYENETAILPRPFAFTHAPSTAMYLALYIARVLLFMQIVWFAICVICCCNLKAEQFAKKYQRHLLYLCGLEALLFVILWIVVIIAYYVDGVMDVLQNGYDRSFGSGFWLFVMGGAPLYLLSVFLVYRDELSTYLTNRRSQRAVARHEMGTLVS